MTNKAPTNPIFYDLDLSDFLGAKWAQDVINAATKDEALDFAWLKYFDWIERGENVTAEISLIPIYEIDGECVNGEPVLYRCDHSDIWEVKSKATAPQIREARISA